MEAWSHGPPSRKLMFTTLSLTRSPASAGVLRLFSVFLFPDLIMSYFSDFHPCWLRAFARLPLLRSFRAHIARFASAFNL